MKLIIIISTLLSILVFTICEHFVEDYNNCRERFKNLINENKKLTVSQVETNSHLLFELLKNKNIENELINNLIINEKISIKEACLIIAIFSKENRKSFPIKSKFIDKLVMKSSANIEQIILKQIKYTNDILTDFYQGYINNRNEICSVYDEKIKMIDINHETIEVYDYNTLCNRIRLSYGTVQGLIRRLVDYKYLGSVKEHLFRFIEEYSSDGINVVRDNHLIIFKEDENRPNGFKFLYDINTSYLYNK